MKSLEELHSFFSNDLQQEIGEVEAKRKAIVTKVYITIALFAILIALSLVFIPGMGHYGWGFAITLVLILGAASFMFVRELLDNGDFYKDFKTKVIEQIVKFIDPSFTYISHKFILPQQFVESKLFANIPKKYKGDDYAVGVLGRNTKVEFSEVVARHQEIDTQKNKRVWVNTFKGLFFVAQVPNVFQGSTFLVPAGQTADSVLKGKMDLQPVPSGNAAFDQAYTIYSTNATEAVSLFSQDLQDRLVEFSKQSKGSIRFSFFGQRISAAFSHIEDLFEPKIFHSLLDFDVIKIYYDDLYQAISTMEDIEFNNTRGKVTATAGK